MRIGRVGTIYRYIENTFLTTSSMYDTQKTCVLEFDFAEAVDEPLALEPTADDTSNVYYP